MARHLSDWDDDDKHYGEHDEQTWMNTYQMQNVHTRTTKRRPMISQAKTTPLIHHNQQCTNSTHQQLNNCEFQCEEHEWRRRQTERLIKTKFCSLFLRGKKKQKSEKSAKEENEGGVAASQA
eukprot:181266_1